MAHDVEVRAKRLETLRAVQSTYVALPIDERVTAAFAELVAGARQVGTAPSPGHLDRGDRPGPRGDGDHAGPRLRRSRHRRGARLRPGRHAWSPVRVGMM